MCMLLRRSSPLAFTGLLLGALGALALPAIARAQDTTEPADEGAARREPDLPGTKAPPPQNMDSIAKAVDTLKANPGHKTEQIVLGSKTFLEQQSKKHDPTESEFLKK